MSDDLMIKILTWAFGICVTGFFFLLGTMIKMQGDLNNMVSKDWIENVFKKDINDAIEAIKQSVKAIEGAVVGTIEKDGIGTRIKRIENKCDRFHPEGSIP